MTIHTSYGECPFNYGSWVFLLLLLVVSWKVVYFIRITSCVELLFYSRQLGNLRSMKQNMVDTANNCNEEKWGRSVISRLCCKSKCKPQVCLVWLFNWRDVSVASAVLKTKQQYWHICFASRIAVMHWLNLWELWSDTKLWYSKLSSFTKHIRFYRQAESL